MPGAEGRRDSGARHGHATGPPCFLLGTDGSDSLQVVTGVQVQRQCLKVHLREDDPGHLTPGGLLRRGSAHSSTPPLSSCTPLAKCGISLLSTMLSAAPIAMCMSRYL